MPQKILLTTPLPTKTFSLNIKCFPQALLLEYLVPGLGLRVRGWWNFKKVSLEKVGYSVMGLETLQHGSISHLSPILDCVCHQTHQTTTAIPCPSWQTVTLYVYRCLSACMSLHHMYAWHPVRAEKGIISTGMGVTVVSQHDVVAGA